MTSLPHTTVFTYPVSVCQPRIIRTPPKRRYFRALCRIRLSPYSKYEQSRLRQKSSKIATFWLPASISARLSLKTHRKTEVRIILGWHRKCSHSAYMKRNSKKPSHSAEKIISYKSKIGRRWRVCAERGAQEDLK